MNLIWPRDPLGSSARNWEAPPRDHRGHAVNRRDRFHTSCADFLDATTEPLVVPAMVVTEVCYLLARPGHGGPKLAATFLDALAAEDLAVDVPAPTDFTRVAHLVRRYSNLPLDAVDAMVIATAERLGTTKVATVDRKDFRIVVPAHGDAFELLPAELE